MVEFERQVNETLWYAIMLELYQGEKYFENDIFIVRPYCWEDIDTVVERVDDKYIHDNSWHFYHKPSGFKLSWYKYPLRSVDANMNISHEQFYAILKDCMNSVPEHNGKHAKFVDKTFEKWW